MAALHFIPTNDCILRLPAHDHPDQVHGIELFEQAGMRFLRFTPHGGTHHLRAQPTGCRGAF